ncbi:MAG: hypothetical protein ACPLXC_03535, partial [Candidatus Pacearchaeota archaeon]
MVQTKRKGNTWFFIVALILAVIIFLFGVLLGNYIAMTKLNEFKQTEERFLIDIAALEIRESILQEDVCKLSVPELFEEKTALGRMLTALERRFGKENEDVIAKKEIYELIEIKVLQYLKKIKQNCNQDFNIVLFFYTNKKADPKGSVDGCEDQGKILDQVVYEHNEKNKGKIVYVFAFDVNSKNQATKALLLNYNIT